MRFARLGYRFAAFLAFGTYLLIIVGGLVHNTDSGMACPDWPLCYGEVFPKLQGGILYEHGHRYLATMTGFGVVLLAIYLWNAGGLGGAVRWARWRLLGLFFAIMLVVAALISAIGQGNEGWRYGGGTWPGLIALWHMQAFAPALIFALVLALYGICFTALLRRGHDERDELGYKGLGLLMLILLQGLLGGATVAYNLPSIVSTAHLGTSMLVLLTMVYLAFALRREALRGEGRLDAAWPPPEAAGVRGLLALTTVLVFVQIVLGALVRHTHASWIAGVGWEHATLAQDPLSGKTTLWPATGPAQLNVVHRYFAVAVCALVAWSGWRAWGALGRGVGDRLGRLLVIWLPTQVVGLQLLVGVAMLGMLMQIGMRTLHLAVGTLVLVAQFVLLLNARAVEAAQSAAAPAAMPAPLPAKGAPAA